MTYAFCPHPQGLTLAQQHALTLSNVERAARQLLKTITPVIQTYRYSSNDAGLTIQAQGLNMSIGLVEADQYSDDRPVGVIATIDTNGVIVIEKECFSLEGVVRYLIQRFNLGTFAHLDFGDICQGYMPCWMDVPEDLAK